ncbi:hypothetical protein [Streptomyces sp. DH10]|nr:hypothetical protein [Streptomyces sp. DH10]MDG9707870.1 hypothetical protein [Streptomyces sp. DH10]
MFLADATALADPERQVRAGIVAYAPQPGSKTAERLALLGSWTSAVP